jgi:phospholipase D1/2
MKTPSPRVWLEPIATSKGVAASFAVRIAGLPVGKKLTLEFFEVDPPGGKKRDEKRAQQSGDVRLGSVMGKVAHNALATKLTGVPSFTLVPEAPPPSAPAADKEMVEFRFPGNEDSFKFAIPNEALDVDEGDYWEIQVRAQAPKIVSPILTIAHVRRGLANTFPYRWHEGNTLQPFHDGAKDANGDQGAFAELMKAIKQAEHFIFVVDWSFHPFFKTNLSSSDVKDTVGAALLKKAAGESGKPVTVAIHTWNHTNQFAPDDQNDSGEKWLKKLSEHLHLGSKPQKLRWRAGSPSGIRYSHHQKFVVLDQPAKDGRRTLRVFFGGLDLTKGRLDWPGHPTQFDHPDLKSRRVDWGTSKSYLTNEWYNGETDGNRDLPRQPWHDIHGCVDGPVAWDFLREFVIRWAAHPGSEWGDQLESSGDLVCEVWKAARNRKDWVQPDEPGEGPWVAQLLRSNTKDRCATAAQFSDSEVRTLREVVPASSEASILEMYRQAIDQADRFIYIENQYLIGSGPLWGRKNIRNDLPERIVRRILAKKGQPFHVYVVTPMFPEGDPVGSGGVEVRNYEWRTIQYMVSTLSGALGADWGKYLTLLFLADWHSMPQKDWSKGKRRERLKQHQRYMVYVHSKMMIVDDRFLVFGSANLNERSLSGARDTEIGCAFWPGRNQEQACINELRGFRKDLFLEHFGTNVGGADDPASDQCVSACRQIADANYAALRNLQGNPQGHACRLPVSVYRGQLQMGGAEVIQKRPTAYPEPLDILPDGEPGDGWWLWTCKGSSLSWLLGDAAE